MYRRVAASRCRACGHSGALAGASERCAPAAALAFLYRYQHEQQQGHGHAIPSSRAAKLRRAMWMRMHPVERWTLLVDLSRRGAYLIEAAAPLSSMAANDVTDMSTPASTHGRRKATVLGDADPKVRFTREATEAHRQLCQALPYAARLHLSLSLLLWIHCLVDVQDTLARVRLPFAVVRRQQRYAVADVFPTRLGQHWVDLHTTVSTKMSARLNSTAEQISAPHTWDAETSETIEDAAAEATVTLDAGRVPHGRHQARLRGKTLLQRVQGVQPRASADDEMAARLTDTGSPSGRRRLRSLLLSRSLSLAPRALSAESVSGSSARPASLEFACDASRRLPPVSLESEPLEDAVYHGNNNRGEGCPLNQVGEASPTPIFIYVPLGVHGTAVSPGNALLTEAEVLVRYCVMAHAAVLSSLFIEGRVVCFCSNHPLVVAYARWLLEELVLEQFVSVSLLAEDEVSAYRPYYPPWCWRSVLVLMPPKQCSGYSVVVLRDWAARIVRAAPCTVLVEGSVAAGYVRQLMDEVQRQQCVLDAENMRAVKWVAVGAAVSAEMATEKSAPDTAEAVVCVSTRSAKEEREVWPYRPQRCPTATSSSSASAFGAILASAQWVGEWFNSGSTDTTARAASRPTSFLETVRETLEDRFYTCEFLYSPTQSCLTPYRLERWVLEQLPSNVRVVGINTSPLDVLYFFPQGVFLSQKVGNAFRYRAVERTIVSKDMVPTWSSHPLRYAATQLKRLGQRWRRRGGDAASVLHAEFSPSDVAELRRAVRAAGPSLPTCDAEPSVAAKSTATGAAAEETASRALVRERLIEYLAEPSKKTLLGLAVARFFRL
ncbi:hypothetical protein GH5_02252 [Leishmania sp. Ghana 2012 LV757]|uniref:hypothetical protein n=1 Tax=Leishmania sp. Ghana 2012 LV757 TaxID=2803181 RepID=UPI001B6D0725|nr:hypothetical protein GH5_02252 [Leishmania sp. Ghana 2012 LV757]